VVVWRSGSALVSINEVNLRQARLVLGWVTVSGLNSRCGTFISVCNQPPRPTQPSILLGSVNKDQLRLGRKRQVWFIPLADERGVCS